MIKDPFQIAPALKDSFLFCLTVAQAILLRRGNEICYKTWKLDLRSCWVLAAASSAQISQMELCEALNINPNVMVKLIDCLEKNKYVRRVRDTKNRRRNVVEVTQKGLDIVRNRSTKYQELHLAVLHPLPLEVGWAMQQFANKIIETELERCKKPNDR